MVEETDPDFVRAVPIIFLLDQLIDDTQQEIASNSWMKFGKAIFKKLPVLKINLMAHALDFPSLLEKYNSREKEIDNRYGNAEMKKFVLYFKEAEERFKNLLMLWHDMGMGMIDERFAYYQGHQPDFVDFSEWGED